MAPAMKGSEREMEEAYAYINRPVAKEFDVAYQYVDLFFPPVVEESCGAQHDCTFPWRTVPGLALCYAVLRLAISHGTCLRREGQCPLPT